MTFGNNKLVKHLVVDTSAFFKRVNLQELGETVHTLPSVVDEVKDEHTREFMKGLLCPVIFERPEQGSIKIIREVARKTGDISVLSATDINLIALSFELHKKYISDPVLKDVREVPANLGYLSFKHFSLRTEKGSAHNHGREPIICDGASKVSSKPLLDCGLPADDDWISEENYNKKSLTNFGLLSDSAKILESTGSAEETASIVACLTTDFAMQNVLFHAGLDIVSLNGMRIREPRTYLLWCRCCFKATKRTGIYFCPICGHASLARVPVTLHEDGNLEFHFSRKYRPRLRGLRQPIHKPQGGKYADEPIYCADQRLPDRRPALTKNSHVLPVASNGLLNQDTEGAELSTLLASQCGVSIFPLNDICSRSALCGIRSDHQVPHKSFYLRYNVEHGLKPTRGDAHMVKARTGNKKRKKKLH